MENNAPKETPNNSAVQSDFVGSHTTSNSNLNSFSVNSNVKLEIVNGVKPSTAELKSKPESNQPIDQGMAASASPDTSNTYIKKKSFKPSRNQPDAQAKSTPKRVPKPKEKTAGNKPELSEQNPPKNSKADQRNIQQTAENKKKTAREKEKENNKNSPYSLTPNITEKNQQSVSNQRSSYGMFNYNKNGGRSGKKAGKPKRPEFGMKRINSLIESSQKLQQMHQDLAAAVKEGAPPRVLKEKTKQFENQFSKLTSDLDRVGKKFNSLGPESMNVLKQKIGDEKFKQLQGALDGAKQCMSPDSLKNIGMEGSKALNNNMQKFTQSLEKMQQSVQALLKTVNNLLSIGR